MLQPLSKAQTYVTNLPPKLLQLVNQHTSTITINNDFHLQGLGVREMVKVKKTKKLDVRVNQRQSEGGDLRISVGKITVHREFTSLWSCMIARSLHLCSSLNTFFPPSLIKRAARETHQKSGAFFPSQLVFRYSSGIN